MKTLADIFNYLAEMHIALLVALFLIAFIARRITRFRLPPAPSPHGGVAYSFMLSGQLPQWIKNLAVVIGLVAAFLGSIACGIQIGAYAGWWPEKIATTQREVRSVSIAPGSAETLDVNCPTGMKAIKGGSSHAVGPNEIAQITVDDFSVNSDTGWRVVAQNRMNQAFTVEIWVECEG